MGINPRPKPEKREKPKRKPVKRVSSRGALIKKEIDMDDFGIFFGTIIVAVVVGYVIGVFLGRHDQE